ncbi:MAG: penicillin-binding protein 2 [Candidatus Margulisiibacteriota bacterium]
MDKKRLAALLWILIVIAAVLVIRLFFLQVVGYSFYQNKAIEQRTRLIKKAANRGDIMDRNGNILATSIDTYSIYINPRKFRDYEELSRLLKKEVKPESKKRAFAWIERKISRELAEKIKARSFEGLDFLVEKKRVYPKGHLASQVLGFVGLDNEGMSGVELGYDEYLKGEEAEIYTESDIGGIELLSAHQKEQKRGAPGMNLMLTIDENIQYFAESALERAIQKYGAKRGLVIVMEVESGEILALAGKPDFDPNKYSESPRDNWSSRAVQVYEPGSTFKVITLAAGLSEKAIDLDTKLKALESIKVGDKTIKNAHAINFGGSTVSPSKMLEESINTAAVQIGLKVGKDRFYRKIRDFGFGERVQAGLPGESKGLLREPSKWYEPDLAMMTFGQSIGVTPLQLISAIGSIGNGGGRVQPVLVKKIESLSENFVKTHYQKVLSRPLSKEVAEQVARCMENVVISGTGKPSKIEGYRIAAKTGTAQKIAEGQKGYLKDKFVASFIGFVPVKDPKIIILVIVDEPRGSIWGATVAGPAFREVARQTLRYLGIKPDMI